MEPGAALVTVTFLAAVVQKVIERVRVHVPGLDGDLVTLVAVVLGTALAAGFGLDVAAQVGLEGLVSPFNYLATGIVIGGGAGIISDALGRSNS